MKYSMFILLFLVGCTKIHEPFVRFAQSVGTDIGTGDVSGLAHPDGGETFQDVFGPNDAEITGTDVEDVTTVDAGCTFISCAPDFACQNGTGLCVPECGNGTNQACPSSAPYCIPQPGLIGHFQCVECLNAAHCELGLACIYYQCIFDECKLDAQCPQPGVCSNYQCIFYECYSATDCPEDEACVNHTCVVPKPCAVTADCPSQYGCIDGACITSECKGAADCGGDTAICWIGIGTPYQCVECTTHLDCPEGQACKQHECVVPTCFNDADCEFGWFCGTYRDDPTVPAMCYQCTKDAYCGEGFVCENFVCIVTSP